MVFSALFMIITAFRFAFTFIILVVSCAINLFLCEPAERSFFCQDVHSSAYRDVVMPCDSDSDDYNL